MLNITVTYFLNAAGKLFFEPWFKKVAELSRQLDGFISIDSQFDNLGNPVVHLTFENRVKLNRWGTSQLHDDLVAEIEIYFIQPKEAKFMEQRFVGKSGPLVSANVAMGNKYPDEFECEA